MESHDSKISTSTIIILLAIILLLFGTFLFGDKRNYQIKEIQPEINANSKDLQKNNYPLYKCLNASDCAKL